MPLENPQARPPLFNPLSKGMTIFQAKYLLGNWSNKGKTETKIRQFWKQNSMCIYSHITVSMHNSGQMIKPGTRDFKIESDLFTITNCSSIMCLCSDNLGHGIVMLITMKCMTGAPVEKFYPADMICNDIGLSISTDHDFGCLFQNVVGIKFYMKRITVCILLYVLNSNILASEMFIKNLVR